MANASFQSFSSINRPEEIGAANCVTRADCYNAAVKIALMITCLGDVLRPEVGQATVSLLRHSGHEVVFDPRQTCCGQPFYNSGFPDMARQQAQYTIDVFQHDLPVVTPSGSCAAMMKVEYPHLLEGDDLWHDKAKELAGRTFELSDFLVNQLKVVDVGAKYKGKVTYHFACHLRGLGATDEAERLIQAVEGVTYLPLRLADQCCGFGGSFSVRYPEISQAMVSDKVACIQKTEADLVVSTDAGCLMNIGGRSRRLNLPFQVQHLAELLNRR